MHSAAVHGSNSRGLMDLRAKRAGPEETEVDSGQVTSEIRDKLCTAQGGEVWHHLYTLNFRCLGSRERSERCRVSRRDLQAKRAGPEETEVNSGQVTSEIRDKRCTAQSGGVWHHLYTVNFRYLGPCLLRSQVPRRRKFTVVNHVRQVLVTRSSSAKAATPPFTLGHHSIKESSFYGPLWVISRPYKTIFEPSPGHAVAILHHGHSKPLPGHLRAISL
ncbi:hypothetical protein TYRP_000661 [Tyrophagus putrescentiae]|nr:hypothetical protein TYRP_000661 [Tyrophagus putrescentiae]